VGTHRQISGAPSSASAPHASGSALRARRGAPLTGVCNTPAVFSPIGRFPHTLLRTAVKGAQAQVPSPAWSPGRRGRAPLAAAPISSGEGIFHPTNCDSEFPQSRKPSQARDKIPSQATRRVGGGKAGYLDANRLGNSERPSKPQEELFSPTAVQPTTLSRTEFSSALPSLLWPLGKARRKDCVSSSVVVNSNGSVAVRAKQARGLRNDRSPRSGLGRYASSKPASFSPFNE
jgi:hypothetical protein